MISSYISSWRKHFLRTGEKTWWLRALPALVQDPGFFPRTHSGWQLPEPPVPRAPTLRSGDLPVCTGYTYLPAGKTPTHTKRKQGNLKEREGWTSSLASPELRMSLGFLPLLRPNAQQEADWGIRGLFGFRSRTQSWQGRQVAGAGAACCIVWTVRKPGEMSAHAQPPFLLLFSLGLHPVESGCPLTGRSSHPA